MAMSAGEQLGAATSAKAAPPLILLGLGDDGHFQACLPAQHDMRPFEREGVVDYNVVLAAELTNSLGSKARSMRQRAGRLVAELGNRSQRTCSVFSPLRSSA